MEQIRQFEWAQDKIDALTETIQRERHEAQRNFLTGENRAQRREREREERRAAKKAAKVKA